MVGVLRGREIWEADGLVEVMSVQKLSVYKYCTWYTEEAGITLEVLSHKQRLASPLLWDNNI
jgi:hypothetical protein